MPGNRPRTLSVGTMDVPSPVPSRYRRALRTQPWDVIGAVAIGGSVGAAARYGIAVAWPTPAGAFPWSIFAINVLGCALIGVLMVLITEVWGVHRLIRPFLGTGVLGGFTTFSTYAVGIQQLVADGAPDVGLLYLAATPVAAIAAVWAAVIMTRTTMKGRRHAIDR